MSDPDLPYQPFYCEENVWKLCREDSLAGDEPAVLVISNRAGACPVWNQRAAPSPGRPVFWDYHVVAVDSVGGARRIWDLDSRLDLPVGLDRWLERSFPGIQQFPGRLHPTFRIVSAPVYLEMLSSDRSHMRDGDGGWKHPPPDWPSIYREERGMNLGRFIDMSDAFVGEVCPLSELRSRLTEAGGRTG